MHHPTTVQIQLLAAEITGYLHADRTIRAVTKAHRAATAAALLARYAQHPATAFGRGFRLRLTEFVGSGDARRF